MGSSFTSTFSVVPGKRSATVKSCGHIHSTSAESTILTLVVDGGERASLVRFHRGRRAHREPRRHREAGGGQAWGDVARCEELIFLQVRNARPLSRISMQHPLDEGGCGWVDVLQRTLQVQVNVSLIGKIYDPCFFHREMQRKPCYPGDGIAVLLYAVVGLLQTGSLKWGLTNQQSVPGWVQTMTIGLKFMSLLCLQLHARTYNIHPSDQISTS